MNWPVAMRRLMLVSAGLSVTLLLVAAGILTLAAAVTALAALTS